MDSCYTGDYTAGDHMHPDITTCNTAKDLLGYVWEESRLVTVSCYL